MPAALAASRELPARLWAAGAAQPIWPAAHDFEGDLAYLVVQAAEKARD